MCNANDSPCYAQERLSGSYINHYITNGGALIPQLGGTATDTDNLAIQNVTKGIWLRGNGCRRSSWAVMLNAVNCPTLTWGTDSVMVSVMTVHSTPSVHGGVVSEPAYDTKLRVSGGKNNPKFITKLSGNCLAYCSRKKPDFSMLDTNHVKVSC